MAFRQATIALLCAGVMQACRVLDGNGPDTGPTGPLNVELASLPPADTLRQTGVAFAFQSDGLTPYRSVVVVVDPGSSGERSFVVDSAWRAEAPSQFPVVVSGPLTNGSHVFELRVEDANGRAGTAQFSRTIHVPEVLYSLQVLESTYPDVRAVGISDDGTIAATAYTEPAGPYPSVPGQVVAWRGGVWSQPRAQPSFTHAAAGGINDHGDIVGHATVSGNTVGFLWRGDSLGLLDVNGQTSLVAYDVDDGQRALVAMPPNSSGTQRYLIDINSGAATSVSVTGYGLRMNGLGQIIGTDEQLYGSVLSVYGGLVLALPEKLPGRHERLNRGVRWTIFGLNDRSEVLGSRDGEPFLSRSGTVEYVNERLPRGSHLSGWADPNRYCLSESGDAVVVTGDDSLYAWSPALGTRRLVVESAGWKIDRLVAMNVHGELVAQGSTATGEMGVLLLSPASAAVRP